MFNGYSAPTYTDLDTGRSQTTPVKHNWSYNDVYLSTAAGDSNASWPKGTNYTTGTNNGANQTSTSIPQPAPPPANHMPPLTAQSASQQSHGKCTCAECQNPTNGTAHSASDTWYPRVQDNAAANQDMLLAQNHHYGGAADPYAQQRSKLYAATCSYPSAQSSYLSKQSELNFSSMGGVGVGGGEFMRGLMYDHHHSQTPSPYGMPRKPPPQSSSRKNYWEPPPTGYYPPEHPHPMARPHPHAQYQYQSCRYPPCNPPPQHSFYYPQTSRYSTHPAAVAAAHQRFQAGSMSHMHQHQQILIKQHQQQQQEMITVGGGGGLNNNNKMSPLRLMRKKKMTPMGPLSPQQQQQVQSRKANDAPALDVRRFLATWADEEEDEATACPPQLVVLDYQDINPEQAELLRWYENANLHEPQIHSQPIPQSDPKAVGMDEKLPDSLDNITESGIRDLLLKSLSPENSVTTESCQQSSIIPTPAPSDDEDNINENDVLSTKKKNSIDLPTSEYRKNKFLDYSEPSTVHTGASESEPSVDHACSQSKKSKKRSRKSRLSKPTIKFSIQKSHDLKISLRVLNEASGEKREDNQPPPPVDDDKTKSSSRDQLFTLKVAAEDVASDENPLNHHRRKRKKLSRNEVEKLYSVSSEEAQSDTTTDGFQVHESVDSAKIKLTFKRRKTETRDEVKKKLRRTSFDTISAENEEVYSPSNNEKDDAEKSILPESNAGEILEVPKNTIVPPENTAEITHSTQNLQDLSHDKILNHSEVNAPVERVQDKAEDLSVRRSIDEQNSKEEWGVDDVEKALEAIWKSCDNSCITSSSNEEISLNPSTNEVNEEVADENANIIGIRRSTIDEEEVDQESKDDGETGNKVEPAKEPEPITLESEIENSSDVVLNKESNKNENDIFGFEEACDQCEEGEKGSLELDMPVLDEDKNLEIPRRPSVIVNSSLSLEPIIETNENADGKSDAEISRDSFLGAEMETNTNLDLVADFKSNQELELLCNKLDENDQNGNLEGAQEGLSNVEPEKELSNENSQSTEMILKNDELPVKHESIYILENITTTTNNNNNDNDNDNNNIDELIEENENEVLAKSSIIDENLIDIELSVNENVKSITNIQPNTMFEKDIEHKSSTDEPNDNSDKINNSEENVQVNAAIVYYKTTPVESKNATTTINDEITKPLLSPEINDNDLEQHSQQMEENVKTIDDTYQTEKDIEKNDDVTQDIQIENSENINTEFDMNVNREEENKENIDIMPITKDENLQGEEEQVEMDSAAVTIQQNEVEPKSESNDMSIEVEMEEIDDKNIIEKSLDVENIDDGNFIMTNDSIHTSTAEDSFMLSDDPSENLEIQETEIETNNGLEMMEVTDEVEVVISADLFEALPEGEECQLIISSAEEEPEDWVEVIKLVEQDSVSDIPLPDGPCPPTNCVDLSKLPTKDPEDPFEIQLDFGVYEEEVGGCQEVELSFPCSDEQSPGTDIDDAKFQDVMQSCLDNASRFLNKLDDSKKNSEYASPKWQPQVVLKRVNLKYRKKPKKRFRNLYSGSSSSSISADSEEDPKKSPSKNNQKQLFGEALSKADEFIKTKFKSKIKSDDKEKLQKKVLSLQDWKNTRGPKHSNEKLPEPITKCTKNLKHEKESPKHKEKDSPGNIIAQDTENNLVKSKSKKLELSNSQTDGKAKPVTKPYVHKENVIKSKQEPEPATNIHQKESPQRNIDTDKKIKRLEPGESLTPKEQKSGKEKSNMLKTQTRKPQDDAPKDRPKLDRKQSESKSLLEGGTNKPKSSSSPTKLEDSTKNSHTSSKDVIVQSQTLSKALSPKSQDSKFKHKTCEANSEKPQKLSLKPEEPKTKKKVLETPEKNQSPPKDIPAESKNKPKILGENVQINKETKDVLKLNEHKVRQKKPENKLLPVETSKLEVSQTGSKEKTLPSNNQAENRQKKLQELKLGLGESKAIQKNAENLSKPSNKKLEKPSMESDDQKKNFEEDNCQRSLIDLSKEQDCKKKDGIDHTLLENISEADDDCKKGLNVSPELEDSQKKSLPKSEDANVEKTSPLPSSEIQNEHLNEIKIQGHNDKLKNNNLEKPIESEVVSYSYISLDLKEKENELAQFSEGSTGKRLSPFSERLISKRHRANDDDDDTLLSNGTFTENLDLKRPDPGTSPFWERNQNDLCRNVESDIPRTPGRKLSPFWERHRRDEYLFRLPEDRVPFNSHSSRVIFEDCWSGKDYPSNPEKPPDDGASKRSFNEQRRAMKCRRSISEWEVTSSSAESDDEGGWVCSVCGYADSVNRVTHIQTHSFYCQSCYLAFMSEAHFMKHLTRKHPEIRKQHHCLLCELSFDTSEDYATHMDTRAHRHLEARERNTINTLFTLLTGEPCPVLSNASSATSDHHKPDWLPNQPGTVHFYNQPTPLSLALQYLKMKHHCGSSYK